jgi:hypothetical protein
MHRIVFRIICILSEFSLDFLLRDNDLNHFEERINELKNTPYDFARLKKIEILKFKFPNQIILTDKTTNSRDQSY